MKTIRSRSRNTYNVLPDQIEDTSLNYVPHRYILEGGGNVLNCITGEIVKDISWDNDRSELIRRWFLVPEEFDISGLMYLMRQERLSRLNFAYSSEYTIFTTMRCNAGCSYCFQDGRRTDSHMSEKVALDVASYIKRHRNPSSNVTMKWFGGEPLMNQDAMRTICKSLRLSDIPYRSYMSTNGDLLPSVPDSDIYLWNLKIVQLTVDYPGKKYEETKVLPPGAYDRLLETSKRLEEFNVEKRIRIHYHPEDGVEPIYKIIEDFKDTKRTTIYISPLNDAKLTKEDFDKILRVEDLLIEYGKSSDPLPVNGKPTQCMGDSRNVKTITPDGGLSPCEHYFYEQNYGSIYSDEYNNDILCSWRSKRKHSLKCTDCPLFPSCELLTNCPAIAKCESGYDYYRIEKIKRGLRHLGGSNEQRETYRNRFI